MTAQTIPVSVSTSALERSPAPYALVTIELQIVWANLAWRTLHGLKKTHPIAERNLLDFVASDDVPRFCRSLLGIMSGTSGQCQGEYIRCGATDTIGHTGFSANVLDHEPGTPRCFELWLEDRTALRTLEHHYEQLFTGQKDAVALCEMIYDAAGEPVDYRYITVNPSFERMFGCTATAVAGKTVTEVWPEQLPFGLHEFAGVAQSGEPKQFVTTHEHGKKGLRDFDVVAFSASHRQFAVIIRDVTDTNNLRSQFIMAQKMETVGHLAGGVAHDFNNLLTVMLISLDGLLLHKTHSREVMENIATIRNSVLLAGRRTKQLLLFSHSSTGHLVRATHDLNVILADFSKMARRFLGDPVQFDFIVYPKPVIASVDDSMIAHVVLNLCINARDAMPNGGTLSLATNIISFDKPNPHNGRTGDFARITVVDNGHGMSPEVLSRIFDPFFTTKGAKGTGLGLPTVRYMVEQHDGWIEVESVPKAGTRFDVYFPLVQQVAQKPAEPERPMENVSFPNRSVLVVEDEAIIRELVVGCFKRMNCTVHQAAHGREALDMIYSGRVAPDLLVTDYAMPEGVSGLDLAHKFRERFPGRPITIMTGERMTTSEDRGYHWMPKPFSLQQFFDMAKKAFDPGVR